MGRLPSYYTRHSPPQRDKMSGEASYSFSHGYCSHPIEGIKVNLPSNLGLSLGNDFQKQLYIGFSLLLNSAPQIWWFKTNTLLISEFPWVRSLTVA